MGVQELPALGSELRRLRLEAGLSQEALAARAGLSTDAIAALERGRRRAPRPSTLRLLADALELGPDQRALLSTIGAPTTPPREDVATLAVPPENRPRISTDPLVGRDEACDEVVALVKQARLLTLTGPAGVGKTRLALAVSAAVQDSFADGACWVSLLAVRDGTSLLRTLAAALGMREEPGCGIQDSLCSYLRSRHLLLVLDHCDQAVGPCAAMCRTILSLVSDVTILVTSRELLRANGEVVWTVAPLSVPGPTPTTAPLESFTSVQMFVQLAQARSPQFSITPENAPAVADICTRLEGLPLAIELAAARTNVLTPQQIAAELDEGLRLLSTSTRKSSARHQTLEGAIGWSYEMLSPAEQALFQRMSVFAGGWTLGALEAGTSGGPGAEADPGEMLELTSRLVDKSLIGMRERRGRARFFMLGPLRQYGLAALAESGDLSNVQDRHAAYYLELAEGAEPGLRGGDQRETLDLLEDDVDNLRVALAWSTTHGNHEVALRLAGALMLFWYLRGRYDEGREWLDSALLRGAETAPAWRAKGLVASGTLALLQCDYALAERRTREGLSLYAEIADRGGVAFALQRLGSLARERGRYDEAERLHRESLECWRELGDEAGVASSLSLEGFATWLRGDLGAAEALCLEALVTFRRLGDREGISWSLISLGAVAQYRGLLDEATACLEEARAVSGKLGFTEGVAWSLNQLGIVARRRGDFDTAWALALASLRLHRSLGDRWRSASAVDELAATAVGLGQPIVAARLIGTAQAIRQTIGTPVPTCERADHDHTIASLRAALPEDALAAEREVGRHTPLDRLELEVESVRDGVATGAG